MRTTTRLRELFRAPGVIVAAGAYDCVSARLIEMQGFPVVYVTGAGACATLLGLPDLGLMTMTELVTHARNIANMVDLPVIADADNGYGNAINVWRTVREYESAGVAGIHIEDQVMPKRCGHFEGKRLISVEEMAGKIVAATEARRDPDFIIIARSDAIAVEGFEAALERGRAYERAGADMIFFDAMRSVEQIRTVGSSFKVPTMLNASMSGKTPFMKAEEAGAIGIKLVIFPSVTRQAAYQAIMDVLKELKETGGLGEKTRNEKLIQWNPRNELVRLTKFQEMEKRYGAGPETKI